MTVPVPKSITTLGPGREAASAAKATASKLPEDLIAVARLAFSPTKAIRTVSVVDLLYGDWTITASSHKYDKETAQRVRFDVPVSSKGSAELTYTVEIRQ